jgi:flavin-dependent dehydrogenase
MKVSILGAGPAGSTAAYYLAARGIDVELIDRVAFPRDKACAGGLFNPLSYYSEFPFIEELKGKNIYNVHLTCGERTAFYTAELPVLQTFLRKDFDYFLLKNAIKQGAKFYIGKQPEGNIIVNATGARRIQDYIHYLFKGIMGYCWIFPKKGYINIGIGAHLPQRDIRDIYYSYIDYLEQKDLISIKERCYRSKIIPLAPIKRFFKDNVLITGDAAGFVRPIGEGIFFAMMSGKLAAQTIIDKKESSWYELRCKEKFGRYLKPMLHGNNMALLNKIMQKAIKISSRDKVFAKMLVENFFRFGEYDRALRVRFLRNLLK